MTLGDRIANLRKDAGYSQEYIAERLEVSRQAVSKWEKDLSSPDTENLIKLAEILNTSVQFLATGKDFYFPESKPITKNNKPHIKKLFFIIFGIIAAILLSAYIFIGLFGTVDLDSGACSGGYHSYLSEKYEEKLSKKFIKNIENSEERYPPYVSARILKEHSEINSNKRDIWLKCVVVCKTDAGNEYSYSVTFKGKRIWYDTYKWTTVSINEDYGNPYIFNRKT